MHRPRRALSTAQMQMVNLMLCIICIPMLRSVENSVGAVETVALAVD